MNSNARLEAKGTDTSSVSEPLKKLAQDIADGKLKAANKRRAAISKQWEGDGAASQQDKDDFRVLCQKLQELNDWQGFATRPKRVELCQRMEVLAAEPAIPPAEKAKAIKELQDAWRDLGPAGTRDAQRLWGRFKAASDTAYQPCAAHFSRQQELRLQNVTERERICSYLEAFEQGNDWDHPDWKALANIINKAGIEWHKYADVPRARQKKLHKRFDRISSCLQARLSDEQNRNHEKKSALIKQAQACNESDDLPVTKSIETIKNLQEQWRAIGVTDRRRDQKLWKAFREQCDLAFAHRDEARTQQKARIQQQRDQTSTLCRRFNESLHNGEVDSVSLKQFQQAFDEAQSGTRDQKALKEYKQLVSRARVTIKRSVESSHRQVLAEVKRKASLCTRLEHGVINESQAEADWEGEVDLAPTLLQRLDSRRAAVADIKECDLNSNREAAELLCVQLEILAGLESPPEAAQTRMQYQVDRLKRELSLGQKDHRSPTERAEELFLAWYCLGKLPEDTKDLTGRFRRAEEKLFGVI